MKINQGWWGSMQSLRGQATGEVDFPPALQWTSVNLLFQLRTWFRGVWAFHSLLLHFGRVDHAL